MENTLLSKRHTLPSSSFVDPAIIHFIERKGTSVTSSYHNNTRHNNATNMTLSLSTRSSSISSSSSSVIHQAYTSPSTTRSLDGYFCNKHKEKFDQEEIQQRLLDLEEVNTRFETRLRILEDTENYKLSQLLHDQPMRTVNDNANTAPAPAAASTPTKSYESLLEKFNAMQQEFRLKEKSYQEQISNLQNQLQGLIVTNKNTKVNEQQQQQQQQSCYKEEDGYLIFDTKSVDGSITHCRVKIPEPTPTLSPPQQQLRTNYYYYNNNNQQRNITKTAFTFNTNTAIKRSSLPYPPKKGLNPNAPEWRTVTAARDERKSFFF